MADEDVAETVASPSKSIDPRGALESGSQLPQPSPALPLKLLLLWTAGSVASFHLAYSSPALSWLILLYLFCLLQLTKARATRHSFYLGLGVGLLTVGPQLNCFWAIFGPGAVALWLILAFWIGLFAAIARSCVVRFGSLWGSVLTPFVWIGLEYFRSELYYLRFSWLNPGYAFSDSYLLPAYKWLGMYGIGFLTMAIASGLSSMFAKGASGKWLRLTAMTGAVLFLCAYSSQDPASAPKQSVKVAGVQMEFPDHTEIIAALDKLITNEPSAELFVLSEYALDGPVPEVLEDWCRRHQRYLIVGGKDPAPESNFYDTAFVIGPSGDIVFRQVKSVPIQFFKDGLPAREQKLWESPWGKIGICICYDLSYVRVTDPLIRLGAQALIVPTMDVVHWGRREHELHARVGSIRAAEYGVPIFRVASSGISQLIERSGRTTAKAGFPAQEERITGTLHLDGRGSLPLDRWLAPFASVLTALLMVSFLLPRRRVIPALKIL